MNVEKNKKYIVFIDFDETLFFKDSISLSNRRWIKKCQEKGHKFVLNTGRSRGNIPACAFKKIKWDYLLCGASYIEKEQTVLYHESINTKDLKVALRVAKNIDSTISLEGETASMTYKREVFNRLNEKEFIQWMNEVIKENEANPITKISFWKKMDNRIDAKLVNFNTIHHSTYFECFIKGHDKGTLMEQLKTLENLSNDNFIGIGDSSNDLAMLNQCDAYKVAMHLGSDDIKKAADYVTKKSTTGVAEVLKNLFK